MKYPPNKVKSTLCVLSHSVVSNSLVTSSTMPARILHPWDSSPGTNTGVDCFPSPGDLPDPEIETAYPVAPALAGEFFTNESHGKP